MWGWIKTKVKKLLQKDNPVKLPIKPGVPEAGNVPTVPTGKSQKIALLVGHGNGDPGATCWNGLSEHEYNKRVAKILLEKVKTKDLKVYFKGATGWAGVYAQLALWRPDLTIELHLNAYNGQAKGCEVLITSELSRSIGEKFAADFCLEFQRVMRGQKGIKWLKSGDRGFGNVYGASKVSKKAILVESFFCDNKNEWIEPEVYADFLVKFIDR